MKQYIFQLDWSATDTEMIVVRAESKDEAEAYARRLGARYVLFHGEVDKIHQA